MFKLYGMLITHNHVISCYDQTYDVMLILGTKITLRNQVAGKNGKFATITVDYSMVQAEVEKGNYTIKEKVAQHGNTKEKQG